MKKDFDSVKMMRDIRDRLYRMYEKNPELRQKNLERIRKKYGIKKIFGASSIANNS